MAKEFVINFIISLLLYLIASYLAYWAWAGIWWGYGLRIIGITRDSTDWLVTFVMWTGVALSTGVSVVLFFFLGRKLNLVSNRWLNYLSVSGSLIIGIVASVATSNPLGFFLASLPFIMLWSGLGAMATTPDVYINIFTGILALLPPTITWLGMLHQSSRRGNIET